MNRAKPTSESRSGMTLIELVVVITVIAVLASVSVRLLHAMLRQQTATTKQVAMNNSLQRLEQTFRADVQRAHDVDIRLSSTLHLTSHQETQIEWKREKDWLVRVEQVGDRQMTEYFDILPEQEHAFAPQNVEGVPFVVLELTAKSDSGTDNSRDSRFVTMGRGAKFMAAAARDLRFQSGYTP